MPNTPKPDFSTPINFLFYLITTHPETLDDSPGRLQQIMEASTFLFEIRDADAVQQQFVNIATQDWEASRAEDRALGDWLKSNIITDLISTYAKHATQYKVSQESIQAFFQAHGISHSKTIPLNLFINSLSTFNAQLAIPDTLPTTESLDKFIDIYFKPSDYMRPLIKAKIQALTIFKPDDTDEKNIKALWKIIKLATIKVMRDISLDHTIKILGWAPGSDTAKIVADTIENHGNKIFTLTKEEFEALFDQPEKAVTSTTQARLWSDIQTQDNRESRAGSKPSTPSQ